MKDKRLVMPKESEKVFNKLEEFSNWSEGELNVWSFEYSVVELFNYYKDNKGELSDEQLYYACVGLVSRIGGAGVLDPVIVYIELLKFLPAGMINREEFIQQFKSKKEEFKKSYEDFPNTINGDFFNYCFYNLEKVGLIEIDDSRLKVKDILELDLKCLIDQGKRHTKDFEECFFKEELDL